MNIRLFALLPLALAVPLTSCKASEAADLKGASVPAGQVWMTPAQIAEAKVEVATVGEQVIDDTIFASGRVALDDLRSGHVFSPVTGRVTTILAQLGQRVKKGDRLATIESPDVGNAMSDVHKAQADLIAAEHDFERKRDLYAQKAASAADVEASEDKERDAHVELERAREKQSLLRIGMNGGVSQTYTLIAPVDGEVLMRNINPGVEVQGQYSGGAGNNCLPGIMTNVACGELFTIGEIDKVWVVGDIYEIDLARVHVGASAKVTTISYPGQAFVGTVDWISEGLDPTTRTARVRCMLDNRDRKLRPMMYSTMAIVADPKKVVAIPRQAIVPLGEYKVVFVQIGDGSDSGRFERVPVDVDESRTGPYVAVGQGVEVGQKVVVNGGAVLSQTL